MDTKHNPIREGQANDNNPNEIGKDHPAKNLKSQEKVDIKESELGRESSQMPADEQIEHLPQIDDDTKRMHASGSGKNLGKPLNSDSDTAERRDDAGYTNDVTGGDNDADWESDANKL